MREVYILPTIDSLDKRYSEEEKHYRKLLKQIDSIPSLISIYKEICNIKEDFECILSEA